MYLPFTKKYWFADRFWAKEGLPINPKNEISCVFTSIGSNCWLILVPKIAPIRTRWLLLASWYTSVSLWIREKEIAGYIEYIQRKLGAENRSFDTILASGYRSSMPHGVASDKKIKAKVLAL